MDEADEPAAEGIQGLRNGNYAGHRAGEAASAEHSAGNQRGRRPAKGERVWISARREPIPAANQFAWHGHGTASWLGWLAGQLHDAEQAHTLADPARATGMPPMLHEA